VPAYPTAHLRIASLSLRFGVEADRNFPPRSGPGTRQALDDDLMPLGVEDLCTHRPPLEQAPHSYEIFKEKEDGTIKIVLQP
jgi:threonine dehydrogenase-like Zn-dependent dehydrogenase